MLTPKPSLSKTLNGLPRQLVEKSILNEKQARDAQQEAGKMQISLIHYLREYLGIDSQQLAGLAAQEFGLPLFDIEAINRSAIPEKIITPALMSKHHAIPLFHRGNRLFIGVSDPTNLAALDEIKFATGTSTKAVLVEEEALKKLLSEILNKQNSLSSRIEDLNNEVEYDIQIGETADINSEDNNANTVDDTPIVRFVNNILLDAIKQGASDIHFEPYEKDYRIRFRTDGILHEVVKPPKNLAPRLSARLKVMSKMDISERRMPQDGRIQMRLSKNRTTDFRVNTLPTMFGEKIVIRILDSSSTQIGIDALGYESRQKKLYLEALNRPQGMILATGPTGSGKTVSLYTGLGILNTPERNISTAEDPVEINIQGINQVLVNNKIGLNFAETLRAFLRQDPDVIMVGEIRDLETAEIAIKAAQTGHLVLSTLHTNSAAETITRLINMGVPVFNIASSISLIIAQRLGRKLCNQCAIPQTNVPHDALIQLGFSNEMLATATIKSPVGCSECKDGYKGRIGIYEVVKITKSLANTIMDGKNSLEFAQQARAEGFYDLRTSALKKCALGLIDLEEVSRITTD